MFFFCLITLYLRQYKYEIVEEGEKCCSCGEGLAYIEQ